MSTRLSKSITSARSCGRSFLAKPMAASWAIGRRVSMLALVSSSNPSAIGRFVLLKNVTACATPSSNTWKSSCCRSVTYRAALSATVTFSETRSTPALNDGDCGPARSRAAEGSRASIPGPSLVRPKWTGRVRTATAHSPKSTKLTPPGSRRPEWSGVGHLFRESEDRHSLAFSLNLHWCSTDR